MNKLIPEKLWADKVKFSQKKQNLSKCDHLELRPLFMNNNSQKCLSMVASEIIFRNKSKQNER